ncbi:MAG: hypothetical protein DME09_20320 [Candidatus Rokuibacteriota bacterium]|nr:MAG: hypothetical protein DME09_20320 [Candidatus Rokubacteria bacterium]
MPGVGGRKEEAAPPVEQVEVLDERLGREQAIEALRPETGALHEPPEAAHDLVLPLAEDHPDLLGGHRRHRSRLLPEQQLGRRLPLPERHEPEHGDNGGRQHHRQQRKDREAGEGRFPVPPHSRSARSSRMTASVSS